MKRFTLPLILLAALALLMFFLPGLTRGLYGQASVSYLSLLTNTVTLAILALSWDLLARTGQVSLAHAAFYGAGAYTTAIIARQFDLPLWIGIPAGGAIAGLLALLLGPVTLRLHGIYFAIATLSFTEVLRAVVQQLPARIAGGAPGINVPALFRDRKSTRLNSSHVAISYAVFCLKKKNLWRYLC